jgi:hypothetical protein
MGASRLGRQICELVLGTPFRLPHGAASIARPADDADSASAGSTA